MSVPPPPPGRIPGTGHHVPRTREITLRLQDEAPTGWRGRLAGGGGKASGGTDRIRLVGTEIVFEHAGALQEPLTIPAGLVAVATVDRGSKAARGGEDEGRFAILHRLSGSAVIPAEEGVEGWLWTTRSGSALPSLGSGVPNLALVFVKPLDAAEVEAAFRPAFVSALAERSPLGTPTVFGLLGRVADALAAEEAFAELGVDRPLTDREVAPAQRRHLPSDRLANPAIQVAADGPRQTSVPPPGAR